MPGLLIRNTCGASCLLLLSSLGVGAQPLSYPVTRTVEQTDNYHGVVVADPYRWLEDDRSAETAAWIKAQNELTYAFLNRIPFKDKIYRDLEKLNNYPKYMAPVQKGAYIYFYKNNGLQNQAVLFRQQGPAGTPEIVLDPNSLSDDGTTRLVVFSLSKNGDYGVFGFSRGGSDWQVYRVMDMKTLKFLDDRLEWIKLSSVGWQGSGFYYSRYPAPEGSVLAAKNENHQVFYHRLGTAQASDSLVYADPAHPQRLHNVATSEDEKLVFLYIRDRGQGKDGNSLWVKTPAAIRFNPVIGEITAYKYRVVTSGGNRLVVETNEKAPNGKVVSYDLASGKWAPLIHERQEALQGVGAAGGKIFTIYFKDVSSKVYVHDRNGVPENEIRLPVLATAAVFTGDPEADLVFYGYSAMNAPPALFTYDIRSRKSTVFKSPEIAFKPEDYEVKQLFYESKDGTRIPASLMYRKGLKRDGTHPTLIYGYGGFGVSFTPTFSPTRMAFLDQGGVYVQPNLRGGGEYGENWHRQGMRLLKQNVFDDLIALAEYLIREQYTSPARLALQGGSNGGLLLGAVLNQRPELFGVAFPSIGVMDMLRFHKFTVGWSWIPEFGSSDNPEDFRNLLSYSPLHNIREGGRYPGILVTTADHDDRVVPAHSYKYAATLQAKAGATSSGPLLIRIDTNSGHGASNAKKALETSAFQYAFMFFNMGLEWK